MRKLHFATPLSKQTKTIKTTTKIFDLKGKFIDHQWLPLSLVVIILFKTFNTAVGYKLQHLPSYHIKQICTFIKYRCESLRLYDNTMAKFWKYGFACMFAERSGFCFVKFYKECSQEKYPRDDNPRVIITWLLLVTRQLLATLVRIIK